MTTQIEYVDHSGTGFLAGLREGDTVVAVNGHAVRDPLEWRFVIAEEELSIDISRAKTRLSVVVEKDYDDEMGVRLREPKFRRCNNKCVFCFVDQNPPGVRRALRFKDEDFRLSFLYGNFVTLTNTPSSDLERIIEQRLSPLYVSVHATDVTLRRRLLGNPRAPDIVPILRRLGQNGIEVHAQIVLVPGLNDGVHLEQTVHELAGLFPWVRSVGIVPVGLTRHRVGLHPLAAFTPAGAKALLGWLKARQATFVNGLGTRFVFASDEFYVMADRPFPSARFYSGYPQIGNGIGMARQFLDEFRKGLRGLERRLPDVGQHVGVDLVTSVLAWPLIAHCITRIKKRMPDISVFPHVVENRWFGSGITVSGLLVGQDIERTLHEDGLRGQVVLLPPNVLNRDNLFLDDMHVDELERRLGKRVVIGSYDFVSSLAEAYNEALSITRGEAVERETG